MNGVIVIGQIFFIFNRDSLKLNLLDSSFILLFDKEKFLDLKF